MIVEQYLKNMKNIQNNFLNFLDNEVNSEENFQTLTNIFDELKIYDDKHKLKSLMHLISQISDYHCRFSNFFCKIEHVLQLFQTSIKKYFSNWEIFTTFRSNKRILLFLIESKIMIMDKYIILAITKKQELETYPHFFSPEIRPFMDEKWFPKYDLFGLYYNTRNEWVEEIKNKVLPDDFYEKRKEGENDLRICQLIREDLIKDFIVYINLNNVPVDSTIKQSIYETNSLLLHKSKVTLIEYAAFFGSLQIFKYLINEGAKLAQSIWIFAIHGNNAEMIHFLEENKIDPPLDENVGKESKNSFLVLLKESIKNHNNESATYFLNYFCQNDDDSLHDVVIHSLKHYNFAFIQSKHIDKSSFLGLCKYDYYTLVDVLLKDMSFDLNEIILWIIISFYLIL